ncbi:MAG: HEAT repeat domain-containing protein [Elusimicrobiota bacterium]
MPVISSEADEKKDEIHTTRFYAKDYLKKGDYEAAVRACLKILAVEPTHSESLHMVEVCRKKINLTKDLIDEAIVEYEQGRLTAASGKLELAYKKDPSNFRIKSLKMKIFVGLGMEYSSIGQHAKALTYLKKAQFLFPEDRKISDMVNMTGSLAGEQQVSSGGVSDEAGQHEKAGKVLEFFEDYQKKSDIMIEEYRQAHLQMREFLQNTRTADLNSRNSIFNKGNVAVAALPIALIAMLLVVFRNRAPGKDGSDAVPGSNGKIVQEHEKKLKKLDIIESELATDNTKENQVALNILSQFYADADFRVRLRAIEVLHKIDPGNAVEMLDKIIQNEIGQIRIAACGLLGEINSEDSIELLIKYTDAEDNEVKKAVLASLAKILKSKSTSKSSINRIESILENIYKDEEWIIV